MSKIPFTVSAKTARLIGQENFANAEGAVIELVKNCYDADGKVSIIVVDAPNDAIYIIDNGDGMTEDIIKEHWMTIGTSNKEIEFLSKNKRIKTGAKGIGRFALDRLGNRCVMHTKTQNTEGVYWSIDWSEFMGKEKKIHQVFAELEQLEGLNLKTKIQEILQPFELDYDIVAEFSENKGTIIKIEGLRDDWTSRFNSDKELVNKTTDDLFDNLGNLIPPLEKNYFKIYFYNTDLPSLYGKVEAVDIEDFDYHIQATVFDDGTANIRVSRNELNTEGLKKLGFFDDKLSKEPHFSLNDFERGYFEVKTSTANLLNLNKYKESLETLNKIGAFDFSFYYIRRGQGEEKEGEDSNVYPYKVINYRDRKRWFDKFGGVKIFRDNFRVRPYGEPNNASFDWLNFANQGSGNSFVKGGWRVKANQAFGIVNISRIDNINFQDKSNREGLQENETFILFKEVIKSIIRLLESDRNKVMRALYEINKEKNKEEANLERARKLAENSKNYNANANTSVVSKITNFTYEDPKANEDFDTMAKAVSYQDKKIFELEERQKMLQVLASAGLIVTSFAHELKSHKEKLVNRMTDLEEILLEIVSNEKRATLPDFLDPFIMIKDMMKVDERLKYWLDFALASVRKNKRGRRKVDMVKYVEELQRIWTSLLSRRQIKLTIDKRNFLEVYFNCHEIDLDSVFNNLISNSADFLKEETNKQREIRISFEVDFKEGISVTYEDNGPGLSKDIINPNQIFEPFYTTKRDKDGNATGTGLGMWIVKEIIDEYKGSINILTPQQGFKLKLILPTN